MPVAVRITPAEAAALNEAEVSGVEGLVLTYKLADAPAILSKVPETSPIWHRLADRLVAVARQLGADQSFFKAPEPAPVPVPPAPVAPVSEPAAEAPATAAPVPAEPAH